MKQLPGTAIYPNRVRDKEEVQAFFGLPEGGNYNTVFHIGNKVLARGYRRIVYGDHGPYIEFLTAQILSYSQMKITSKFGNDINFESIPNNPKYYYYWVYPEGHKNFKIYYQLKTVHDLPNAPKRGDRRKSNYNREEGYADYQPGYFYISPWEFKRTEVRR